MTSIIDNSYKMDVLRTKLSVRTERENAQLFYSLYREVKSLRKKLDIKDDILFEEYHSLYEVLSNEINKRTNTKERSNGLFWLLDWMDHKRERSMMLVPEWLYETITYKIS